MNETPKPRSKRRSSSSSKKRRSNSTKKSISKSSKLESASVLEEQSQDPSTIQEEPEKTKINYQDELVLIFFNNMLDTIVEEWTAIPEEPPPPCKCFKSSLPECISSKDFKELLCEDIVNMEVKDVRGSIVSLIKKRKSEGSRQFSKELDLPKLKKIDKFSITNDKSKTLQKESSETKQSEGSALTNETLHESTHSLDFLLRPQDEKVIIKFKNGNRYEGPVSKLMMHGNGKFIWTDGAIYEGDFIYGNATGIGSLVYPDLTTYKGSFCKSFLHGEGVLNISSTTMLYSGEFRAGMKNGKGWLLYESENWYEGEWFEDQMHGEGLRQYKLGAKYQGHWYEGKRHGPGTCVWSNNDFYKGAWENGLRHGYGEYTWNAFLNTTFTFPIENTYCGTWLNGMRDGVGIMHFGLETGVKLAGTWQLNQKHGPGVMVCGNGRIIERNPLFSYDKPTQVDATENNTKDGPESAISITNRIDSTNSSTKSTLKLIAEQVYSRCSISSLNTETLKNMAKSQETFKAPENTVKIRPYFYSGKIQCQPMLIPVHSGPDKIDLSYYISLAVNKYTEELYEMDFYTEEANSGIKTEMYTSTVSKYSKWNTLKNLSEGSVEQKNPFAEITLSPSEYESKLISFQNCQTEIEEKYLRNTIIQNLPNLRKFYDKYAAITTTSTLNFKCVLIRMFLWQMIKDTGVLGKKYSLIDMDNLFAKNPVINLERQHYPFEKIDFWQFLQILLTLSWFLHSEDDVTKASKQFGILPVIFEKFLTDVIYKETVTSSSCSLFEYQHLLPINSVYLLYQNMGEPHTARTFLNNICPKKGKEPLCYLKTSPDKEVTKLTRGFNSVLVGGYPIFMPDDPVEIGKQPEDPLPDPPNADPFREELFVLRSIGPKNVLHCLRASCPQIEKDGVIVNMEYPLAFIEFYDALLLCAFMVIDKGKKQEERIRLREEAKKIRELMSVSSATISKTSKMTKEKKRAP